MKVHTTPIPGVLLVEPQVFGDARGFFLETYRANAYTAAGIPGDFVQDNVSRSRRGALRGLHFQHPHGQGKLVQVLDGEVFDVAVDVRVGSPTFGKWVGRYLNGETKHQLYIPPGFAHGFVTTSVEALFVYKCTDYYSVRDERSVRWDDPAIGIEWPMQHVELSAKDREATLLADMGPEVLPRYEVAP